MAKETALNSPKMDSKPPRDRRFPPNQRSMRRRYWYNYYYSGQQSNLLLILLLLRSWLILDPRRRRMVVRGWFWCRRRHCQEESRGRRRRRRRRRGRVRRMWRRDSWNRKCRPESSCFLPARGEGVSVQERCQVNVRHRCFSVIVLLFHLWLFFSLCPQISPRGGVKGKAYKRGKYFTTISFAIVDIFAV